MLREALEAEAIGVTDRVNSPVLRLMVFVLSMLVVGSATAAGQSVSLKDAARALGGKASTMSDVDLPRAPLPDAQSETPR